MAEEKSESSTPPPQQTQAIDIERVVAGKVKELESRVVKEIQGKVVSALSPSQEKRVDPIHERFVSDPSSLISEIEQRAVQKAEEKIEQRQNVRESVNNIMAEIHQEFPELKSVPREVYGEYENAEGSTLKEKLVNASKAVASRLNLKSRLSKEKEDEVKSATMAPSGRSGGAGESATKSDNPQLSYIRSLQEAHGKRVGLRK